MKNTDATLRMTVSAIMCAGIMLFDFLGFPKTAKAASSPLPVLSDLSDVAASTVNPVTDGNGKTGEEKSAVTAASDLEARGKILNKFISPYTANTSYNGVYLKNSTDTAVDIKSLLEEDLNFKIEKNGEPQVLIVHSHATESFMLEDRDYYTAADTSRSTDNTKNTVALGKIVADKLNAAGIVTVHSEVQHDYPDYNYSYTNASKTIRDYLKKYPSIKIVLDMHRDAVGGEDKVKVTTKIDGKSAAQVMLVMGTGFDTYKENLKLAVRFQQTLEALYPSLARSISLVGNEYNESLTNGSMLIEMGTDANTLEEVKYSAELVGNALISLCNTEGG